MLTDKQKKYAQARAKGMDVQESAIAAGYSRHSAKMSGLSLEKNAKVQEMILELQPPELKTFASEFGQHLMDHPQNVPITDPLDYFRAVMSDPREPRESRMEAAKMLAAYTVPKPAPKSKRERDDERAEEAIKTYAPLAPPTLRVVQ